MQSRRPIIFTAALAIGLAACVGASEPGNITAPSPTIEPQIEAPQPLAAPLADAPVLEPTPSPSPAPTAAPPMPAVTPASVFEIVSSLAADELIGRDNQTAGSVTAQDFLVDQLRLISEPVSGDTEPEGYRFDFDRGTNLIGIVPGTDLADEFVIVGAHYDHVGTVCRRGSPADQICNGAADNAAGVAAALHVARTIADQQPRRSVLIALWDAEEDGLLGARHYIADPVVPLAQTVAYINFDIQGANLSPSLSRHTMMIGAETGGEPLRTAAQRAAAQSPLATASFSLIFGQGRSDHAPFASAGVPILFLTDATNGCYHTVDDDLDALDFAKLDLQIATATRLVLDLANTDTPPSFDPDTAIATFDDAVNLFQLVAAGEPDFALVGPQGAAESAMLLAELDEIVQAGPDAFDSPAVAVVLGGAAGLVERLANSLCLPVAG